MMMIILLIFTNPAFLQSFNVKKYDGKIFDAWNIISVLLNKIIRCTMKLKNLLRIKKIFLNV